MTGIRKKRAVTFMELTIGLALMAIVSGGIMGLLFLFGREHRVSFVEQRVFEHADRLQDRITVLLHTASRSTGVFYADPVGSFYHRIVFRKSVGAPNEELSFDPSEHTLTYDPDISVDGDEELLGLPSESYSQLRDIRFRSAMKTGGIPDSGIIIILLEVTDRGYARRHYRDSTKTFNHVISSRTFAVNLRRL